MREQDERIQEIRLWVEKAEHDLRNAVHTLTLEGEDCPLDTVCFHTQQCAEKYLKVLLIFHGVEFPKTHDLEALIYLLPKEMDLHLDIPAVLSLNRYPVEARYPGDWDPMDREEAERAVQIAQAVRDAVRALLPPDALE